MGLKHSFSGASHNRKPSLSELTDFVDHAATGNVHKVKKFCERYPDYIDALDDFGQTALAAAAANNQFETGQILLFAGADPNKPTADGISPFFIWATAVRPARDKKDMRLGESMVFADADVNFREWKTGKTALMFYSSLTNEYLCDFLLKHNADPTARDRNDMSARDHALTESDKLDDKNMLYGLKEEIDCNILKLETAEKEWPHRAKPARLLAQAAVEHMQRFPN